MGARQVYRLQTDQRSIRNRDREAFLQASYQVSSVLGSGVIFLRVEARREGEAALAHPAQGWIANGVRRAVGDMEVAGRGSGGVLYYPHNRIKSACRAFARQNAGHPIATADEV
jgi:hypothetical protein